MKKQSEPRILYRFHNKGDYTQRHPIVTRYNTTEEFFEAMHHTLKTRRTHALFSNLGIINSAFFTLEEAQNIMSLIKKNTYTIPEKSPVGIY